MSTKIAIGSIPEKICYVFSDEQEVFIGCEWDIDYSEKAAPNKAKVLPAFPVDENDVSGKSKATSWAERSHYNSKDKKTAQYDTVDNKPISGVKVFSLEHRGQSGRAYKAVIGKYYVDLREDVLMDTMLQAGVDKGGVLLGEYVWAKMRSNMKLVRVGSEIHRLIVEFDSKKDLKPFNKNDLEVGGVYRTRQMDHAIFIGYINTTIFHTKHGRNSWDKNKKVDFDFNHKVIKKAMLFYNIYDIKNIASDVDKIKSVDNKDYFIIKATHTYIEKIDNIDLPEDIIESVRQRTMKEAKKTILEYTGHIPPKQHFLKADEHVLEDTIVSHSNNLNMYKYGDKPVDLFDVKKFLLFS